MSGRRVRFDPNYEWELMVDGLGAVIVANEGIVAPLETIGPAFLTSLRRALLRYARHWNGDTSETFRIQVSATPAAYFDDDFAMVEPVGLVLDAGRLLVEIGTPCDKRTDPKCYRRTLAPLLARRKAELVDIEVDVVADEGYVRALVDWPIARRTVHDAVAFGGEVVQLLEAAEGGELSFSTTLDLLRAGRWELLVGQPESQWLDAKREPYDRSDPNWRYELAKDVAAFANADGGLIVLGLTAADRGDGEVITGRHFFPLRSVDRQAYRNVVAHRIYPRVVGFDICRIEIDRAGRGNGLVVLVIPPQPNTAWPFIVHGLVRNGAVLGAHLLLPIRQEDETKLLDPAALHARLRLGEEVLAGRIPRSTGA